MDYRRYRVWPKAYELTRGVYAVTRQFPIDERFGLVSQMRRAATSVLSNFAEGMGRSGDRDKARFVRMSIGSLNELEVQLQLSRDFEYVSVGDYKDLNRNLTTVRSMLTGLANTLSQPRHERPTTTRKKQAAGSGQQAAWQERTPPTTI